MHCWRILNNVNSVHHHFFPINSIHAWRESKVPKFILPNKCKIHKGPAKFWNSLVLFEQSTKLLIICEKVLEVFQILISWNMCIDIQCTLVWEMQGYILKFFWQNNLSYIVIYLVFNTTWKSVINNYMKCKLKGILLQWQICFVICVFSTVNLNHMIRYY